MEHRLNQRYRRWRQARSGRNVDAGRSHAGGPRPPERHRALATASLDLERARAESLTPCVGAREDEPRSSRSGSARYIDLTSPRRCSPIKRCSRKSPRSCSKPHCAGPSPIQRLLNSGRRSAAGTDRRVQLEAHLRQQRDDILLDAAVELEHLEAVVDRDEPVAELDDGMDPALAAEIATVRAALRGDRTRGSAAARRGGPAAR